MAWRYPAASLSTQLLTWSVAINVAGGVHRHALGGVSLDTTLMGRVAVRESLVLRMGYSGTDFTDNVVRWVAEERMNLAVERPAAICWITGLPTAAPTGLAVEEAKSTAKKEEVGPPAAG